MLLLMWCAGHPVLPAYAGMIHELPGDFMSLDPCSPRMRG